MTTITISLTQEQVRALFQQLPQFAAPAGIRMVEDYLDFTNAPEIRIKGHRIWLEHIVEHYLAGSSPEDIVKEYPGLGIEKVYAALAYYLANREMVDAYMAKQREEAARAIREQAETPKGRRLLEIVNRPASA
jgi:uncharacterized protein (DUF433 family)